MVYLQRHLFRDEVVHLNQLETQSFVLINDMSRPRFINHFENLGTATTIVSSRWFGLVFYLVEEGPHIYDSSSWKWTAFKEIYFYPFQFLSSYVGSSHSISEAVIAMRAHVALNRFQKFYNLMVSRSQCDWITGSILLPGPKVIEDGARNRITIDEREPLEEVAFHYRRSGVISPVIIRKGAPQVLETSSGKMAAFIGEDIFDAEKVTALKGKGPFQFISILGSTFESQNPPCRSEDGRQRAWTQCINPGIVNEFGALGLGVSASSGSIWDLEIRGGGGAIHVDGRVSPEFLTGDYAISIGK